MPAPEFSRPRPMATPRTPGLASPRPRRAAIARGLVTQPASVEQLVIADGAVTGVIADGSTYAAASVAIAGGAWSPDFADQLGVQIPVEPLRGQIVHLGLPGINTS